MIIKLKIEFLLFTASSQATVTITLRTNRMLQDVLSAYKAYNNGRVELCHVAVFPTYYIKDFSSIIRSITTIATTQE